MKKNFHKILGVSILPALLMMPAMAEVLEHRVQVNNLDTVLKLHDVTATGIESPDAFGGVVMVWQGKADVKDSVFKNNIGYVAGVMADYQGDKTGLIIDNTTFESNHAVDGGAVGIYKNGTISNSIFSKNTAGLDTEGETGDSSESDGGGALFTGGTGYADISNVLFIDNDSAKRGGAISGRHVAADEYLNITNNTRFVNNHSGNFGGAVANVYAGIVTVSDSSFTGNSADKAGGAIFNGKDMNYGTNAVSTDHGTIRLNNTTFTGNTAVEKGGAIYNDDGGIISLTGSNSFTGNMANETPNDIYNLGTVNIVSGTTTMDGGIDGTGLLTIAKGATLNVGTASITQSSIDLNGTLIAKLVGDDVAFNVDTFESSEDTGLLNLTFEKEGTYNLLSSDTTFNNIESKLYDLDFGEGNKTVTAIKKSVEEIASGTGMNAESAVAISHIADVASVEEAPAQLRNLSIKLQEKLAGGDVAAVAAVEHATKAIHPETESVAQSVSSSVQNTVVNVASARMALPAVGRNGGDVNLTSGGVWAQGLFNKSKQNDSFRGYTRGIAAGLDGTINKVWTIGAGYSFAHSDISGSARDTEIDSNTVFVYGQYKPSEWYINAVANYTMSDYSEKGTVIDNDLVFADYDINSFGGTVATGYDFANGITPELGLRYMHVNDYDYTNTYGIKSSMKSTDFLTGVLGAKYAFNIEADKHLSFAPQLNAGVKYDMLSDKSVSTVTMPGVDAYTLNGNRLNRLGGEFGIGLGMQYDALQVSLNYDIDVRKDYTSQTGMLKFRYNF